MCREVKVHLAKINLLLNFPGFRLKRLRPSLHHGNGKQFELKIVGALPAGFVAQNCLREGKVPPTNFPPTLLHCQQREQAVDHCDCSCHQTLQHGKTTWAQADQYFFCRHLQCSEVFCLTHFFKFFEGGGGHLFKHSSCGRTGTELLSPLIPGISDK